MLRLGIGDVEGAWNNEAFDAGDAPRTRQHVTWCRSILLVRHQGCLLEVAWDWGRVQRVVLNGSTCGALGEKRHCTIDGGDDTVDAGMHSGAVATGAAANGGGLCSMYCLP